MRKLLILSLFPCSVFAQQGIDPNFIRSMTYGQCKANPTVRFVAEQYKQKYPSTSMNQILGILCKESK